MDERKDNIKDFDPMDDKKSWFEEWDKFRPLKTMLKHIEDKKIKPETLHIRSMFHQGRRKDLWAIDMAQHRKRIHKADTSFPIIINRDGMVLDWYHRITKAIIEWKKTIKAYRIALLDVQSVPNT